MKIAFRSAVVKSRVTKSRLSKSFAVVSATLAFAPWAHAQTPAAPPSGATSPVASSPKTSSAKVFDHSMDAQLRRAVNADNDGSVRNMLVRGADPNLKDTDAWKSPLLAQAAFIGNLKMVRAFVEAGADLEATSSQGSTAMQYAILRGRGDIIAYLKQQGANIELRSSAGTTPLMDAVAMGKIETVRTLIEVGADINARAKSGDTALIKAVSSSLDASVAMEIVKVLVNAGADVSIKANNDKVASDIAGDYKLYDINNYLVDIYVRDNALFNAAAQAAGLRKGDFPNAWSDARKALDNGANGRFGNASGETALILLGLAVKDFDEGIAKQLIAVSEINAQAKNGSTALYAAAQSGNEKMVALLLAQKADFTIANANGFTPLDYARTKFPAIATMLRNAGAKDRVSSSTTPNSATSSTQAAGSIPAKSKWTPEEIALLSPAAREADERLYNALNELALQKTTKGALGTPKGQEAGDWNDVSDALDDGAPLLYRGVSGTTVLMLIAENLPGAQDSENRDLIQDIIADADLDAQDDDGMTALHIAAKNGYLAMVNWLLKAGAASRIADKAGKTPLDLALQANNSAVAARLRDASNSSSRSTTSTPTSVATPSATQQSPTPQPAANTIAKSPLDKINMEGFNQGLTVLMLAAKKNDVTEVARLLKSGATVDIVGPEDGDTALFFAAFGNSTGSIKALLKAGANINFLDFDGEPPLVSASFRSNATTIRALVEAGADLQYLDAAIKNAQAGKNQAVLDYLNALKQKPPIVSTQVPSPTPPPSAAPKATSTAASVTSSERTRSLLQLLAGKTFDATAADALLRQGADINSPDANGKTPLMIAGESGLPAAVKWLVLKKVNVNAADKNGMTALMYIASRADDKAANDVAGQLIFADGLNFSLKNQASKTALEIATAKLNEKTAFTIDIASVL